MRKATNMPIDKELLKKALKRDCLCQVEVERVLGLKRGTIANNMYHGSANPKTIEALEKKFGIKYDDIRPVLINKIEGDVSASRIMAVINKTARTRSAALRKRQSRETLSASRSMPTSLPKP